MGKFTWLYENEASMIVQKVIKPSVIFSSETVKNQKSLFLDLYENGVFPHFSIGMDVAKNECGMLLIKVWRSNWVIKIEDISVLRKAFYVLVKMFAKTRMFPKHSVNK